MSESGEENEFVGDEESSDDVPMSSLRNGSTESTGSPTRRKRSQVNYADDDNDEDDEFDDDDEDDVPLSALASPSTKKKKKTNGKETPNGKKKKATPAKKKTSSVKKKAPSSTASVSSAKNSGSSSNFKTASAALYGSECQKGMLIQRLLCRWWYAIEWPDPAAIPNEPPPNYDPLDGFPGVYVCTDGEEVGAIKDFRDKDKCPNFINMAKKSSEELQTLLIKALTEQRKQLIEAEGTGTGTQKELDDLLKWASKVKPATADKEAAKLLKAAKFTLD